MATPREIADERLASGEISQEEHAAIVEKMDAPTLLDPVPETISRQAGKQGSDDREWFYVSGAEKKGPHSREEIIALAKSDVVSPDTLVWTSGMAGWEALGKLPLGAEIHALLSPGGPPAVPQQGPGATQGDARPQNDGSYSPASVGFSDAIRLAFHKYADFSTRIGRPEYWYFVLFSVLGGFATFMLDAILFGSAVDSFAPINSIFSLALLIPSISTTARRLHDTDRSGWWQLIVLVPLIGFIVLLVFLCSAGTRGRNRFG